MRCEHTWSVIGGGSDELVCLKCGEHAKSLVDAARDRLSDLLDDAECQLPELVADHILTLIRAVVAERKPDTTDAQR